MKLNIQKRVLPLLCALALIVACSFGVPAGAWTIDDDPDSIVEYYNAFNLHFDADMGSIFGLAEYAPGEWPETYTATNLKAGTYTPFKITDLPFKADYGACFIFMLPADILAACNSVRVCVQALAINVNTVAEYKLWTSGEVVVTSGGNGAVFGDDVSAFFFQDGEFCLFYIQGSLIRDVSSAHIQIDLMEYDEYPEAYTFDYSAATPVVVGATANSLTPPSVDSVTVSPAADGPYYPGSYVHMQADVFGAGDYDKSVTWSVDSGLSGDVTIDENGLLYIPTYEQALSVEVTATSVQDPAISGTYTLDITYPLEGVSIVPGGTEYYPYSSKDRTIQYSLLLPNGDPYEYEFIQWIIEPTAGHEEYFSVDDVGMVTIKGGAPAGSGYSLRWCYAWDTDNVAPGTANLNIVSNQEFIQDQLTPTPEQSDKVDDFNNQIDNVKPGLDQNINDLNKLEKPDISDIKTNPSDFVDQAGIDGAVMVLGTLAAMPLVSVQFLAVVGLMLVAYILHGKKG